MTQNNSISVVIPCYNAAQTIKQCIASIFSQTVCVNEIIVVDDGSTDGSREIVQEIFDQDKSNITKILVEQENSGPSIARNAGVKLAASTHIAFLDSDDHWFENKIEYQRDVLNTDSGHIIIGVKYVTAPITYSGEISFEMQLYKNYFLTPGVLISKKAFLEAGGFNPEMRHAEDYAFWTELLFQQKGFLIDYIGASNLHNKKIFGEKGLSADLKKMHRGILSTYKTLYSKRKIAYSLLIKLLIWERIKYLRRVILTR